MRSTFAGLNTMVRGINSNQLSLDTVGHNISNASTTGYSRQSVNLAATMAQEVSSMYGTSLVGSGVDSTSIVRARNVYADKQYWRESADNSYYATRQTDYDKIEAVFDDSDSTGIQNAMESFYKSWSELSTSASTSSARVSVVENGKEFADKLATSAESMQKQIEANYDDLKTNVTKVNDLTDQIVKLNKNIATVEASGGSANDLRDQRDNLTDELSTYASINVYEDNNTGMYTIVSNGTSLVNGITKLNLQVSEPITNTAYGINDYQIQIKETGTSFDGGNGKLKGNLDAVAEDKNYMDKLSNMAAYMMTTFNAQHKAGTGIDSKATTGLNFYGENDTAYLWDNGNQCVQVAKQTVDTGTSGTVAVTTYAPTSTLKGINIINALKVNSKLTETNGENLVAARAVNYTSGSSTTTDTTELYYPSIATLTTTGTKVSYTISSTNGTADGSNSVLMSALFNSTQANTTDKDSTRSIGQISLESYYNNAMSALGVDSSSMDTRVTSQEDVMTQITNWRSSTSGVNWNEELTNMIKFQQGYSACSRCLTTMDSMLDKLINSTGEVGR